MKKEQIIRKYQILESDLEKLKTKFPEIPESEEIIQSCITVVKEINKDLKELD